MTDSQNDSTELREQIGETLARYDRARTAPGGDAVDIEVTAIEELIALIAQREQAAELRGRINELEQLPPHTTKLGYSYLVERLAELEKKKETI